MSLDDGEKNWIQDSFNTINKKLDQDHQTKRDIFKKIDEQSAALAKHTEQDTRDFGEVKRLLLEAGGHVKANGDKLDTHLNDHRARRKWWFGILGTILGGVILTILLLMFGLSK